MLPLPGFGHQRSLEVEDEHSRDDENQCHQMEEAEHIYCQPWLDNAVNFWTAFCSDPETR